MVCRYELFYAEYFYLFALFSLLYYHFITAIILPHFSKKPSSCWIFFDKLARSDFQAVFLFIFAQNDENFYKLFGKSA